MNNFVFQNPTRLVFGKGTIAKTGAQIPTGQRIMLTFGGGSVRQNGVYDQVTGSLREAGHTFTEFWGIEPNPTIETLRRAIQQGKNEKIDFLLAVGGGSVLDATKLISAGLRYDGDPWEIVLKGRYCGDYVPMGAVLTLPATGSEMNSGAVISNTATHEKFAFYNRHPVFSILDPEVTFSLPPAQIAYGLADTFVHIMEQYLTAPGQSRVMDRWAEGLLSTLVEIAPRIRQNPKDYDLMADFMLSATMALNGFISMGVTQDWATHMIGHELTALHGLSHGATLVIVLPGLMRVLRGQKAAKILQYGERIWGVEGGSEADRIDRTIEHTETFFRSLGLSTRLSEEGIGKDTIAEIERRFAERGAAFGEKANVDAETTAEILRNCL